MSLEKTDHFNKSLKDRELAQISGKTFDLPPKFKSLLLFIGSLGFILIIMLSITGGSEQTIKVDKVIHFFGYALMALVFTLALRPKFIIALLLGIAAISILIEFAQIPQGRQFEILDMLANTSGILIGLIVGLSGRLMYNYIHKEMVLNRVRKHILRFAKGQVILQEGHPVHHFYIIKSGKVGMKHVDQKSDEYAFVLGAGEVIGAVGTILNIPQEFNAYALENTQVYEMNLKQLMESTGGDQHPAALLLHRSAEHLIELSRKVEDLNNQLEFNED